MASPLLSTKLFLPRHRPGLVARPRLLERLSLGSAARLTVVSAPPGFGKTTLIADWLHGLAAGAGTVAWVSLDAADNDAGSFWAYVVGALEAAVPTLRVPGRDLVGQVPIPQVISTLVNELAAVAQQVWLVLDDYHLVDSHEVHESVLSLLEHLPPQVHVLISTRVDPDLPLSRWRAQGELVEVRSAELRFTRQEVTEYLSSATDLELSSADVIMLAERTEGWIAALKLAALSLRGHADASSFVERFAGDDRYIMDYLMDEVLAHQPEDVRDFLVQTALLDRLTGGLCDAVTGRENSGRTLAALERANLFVVPLDDQLVWFRYHHLFADVLRARLLAERPEQVPLLHRRASSWYQDLGLTDDAIRHSLAAEDFDRASMLVEMAVSAARRDRQDAMLTRWLRALPEEVIRRSPVLSVFHGWTLLGTGDLEAVESRLEHAENLLATAGPGSPQWVTTDALRTLPSTIAVYRAALAQARGDLTGTADHARHALELVGPGDHLVHGAAAGFLGLVAWSTGDISLALETFSRAVASLHAAGYLVDELSSTALLGEMWTVAGRPATARDVCVKALATAEPLGVLAARATADLHVQLGELDMDAGDMESAQRHLEAAEPLEELVPASEGRYRWFVAAGRLALAGGEHERAIALLDEAEVLYQPGYFPSVRPIPAIRARVWIASRDLVRAAEWVETAGVSVTDEASYLKEYEHLTLVRVILAQHQTHPDTLEGAARLLGRLQAAAEGSGRVGSLAEIGTLLALTQQPHRLAEGLPPTVPMPASDALTARESQVLALLDSALTGPEIARHLFVSRNTLRTHTKHIFTKLAVTSRRAAVARARERGLL